MSEKPATEKPIFSFKELMYVLTLALGFFIQHFTMKQEIHDAIVEMSYSKKELMQMIAATDKRVDAHDKALNWLTQHVGSAIKPKEIQIEPE